MNEDIDTDSINDEFTSQFRTNGYSFTEENEDKLRKMFNDFLHTISTSIYTFEEIQEGLLETVVGDGMWFEGFSLDKGNTWWDIQYSSDEYDEETDDYYIENKSQSVETFGIGIIAVLYDDIMKKVNINKVMKNINI